MIGRTPVGRNLRRARWLDRWDEGREQRGGWDWSEVRCHLETVGFRLVSRTLAGRLGGFCLRGIVAGRGGGVYVG